MKIKRSWVLLVVVFAVLVLVGCRRPVQETMVERNRVLGEREAAGNFFEAQQIATIEDWKDDSSKLVNVYIINPVTGGLLVPPIQCMGVPASSTESLEPNDGAPACYGGNCYDAFQVPVDGVDIRTTELSGRDGTYGDPVPFRQCMSVDGQYHDWSQFMDVLVSSASYTFSEATTKRDFEAEARLIVAEEILRNGGCVDVETLQEIECK
jgi:hypothetical protein